MQGVRHKKEKGWLYRGYVGFISGVYRSYMVYIRSIQRDIYMYTHPKPQNWLLAGTLEFSVLLLGHSSLVSVCLGYAATPRP